MNRVGPGRLQAYLQETLRPADRIQRSLDGSVPPPASCSLRQRRDPVCQGFGLLLSLAIYCAADLEEIQAYVRSRLAEPLFDVTVQHIHTKDHQEDHRSNGQHEGSEDQLGSNTGSLAIAVAFDVKLDE